MHRLRKIMTQPATIFAAALLVRLLYLVWFFRAHPPIPSDHIVIGYETGRIARSIAQGRGFSSPLAVNTGPTAWMTPVYPYLLAAVFKIFGVYNVHSEIAIKIINNIFSALVCFPLYVTAKRLFGPTVAAAAGWTWVFLYGAIYFPSVWVWDTSLSALAMMLVLWATYELDDRETPTAWASYGAICAFGVLVNATILSVLPGLFTYAAFRARQRGAAWARLITIAGLVLAAGVSPWVIRNELVFHGQVSLRSNFGLEFWLGNNADVPDSWTPWLHPNDNDEEREKFGRMGEVPYMQEKQRLALQFVRTHPKDFLRFGFHRFINNWTGTWDPLVDTLPHAPPSIRAILLSDYLFTLLALTGLLFARRADPVRSAPLWVLCLFFPLVYYITHTSLRYRHPIDPAMTILVVYAIAYPLRLWHSKRVPQETLQLSTEPST
jgi:4-amino-4-deoxy-L-arabinose transferase-like glycosyltransferase